MMPQDILTWTGTSSCALVNTFVYLMLMKDK